MTREDAEKLSVLLMQVSGQLDQSAKFVMDKDSEENFETYRMGVGKVMGELFLEVMQPLWQRFPDLLPDHLDGPYKVSPDIYKPYFYRPDENS